jgi:uncharacterized protein (TIRG00374 family)
VELISKDNSLFLLIKKNRARIITGLKILISAGLLAYLVIAIDYKSIFNAIKEANILLILIVLGLGVINILLQYLKWKLTCSKILNENSGKKILSSLFYGFSGGIITPLRVGEFFGRAISFKDKPFSIVTIATLIDKFFPLMIVTSLGAVSSLLFIYYYFEVSFYITAALFITLFSSFYLFAILALNERFWDSMFFSRLKKIKSFNNFITQVKSLKSLDKNFFTRMTGLSFLFYACYLVQFAILVLSFSHNFNFLEYIWAGMMMVFAKTVIPPISLGELGIREGASVFFLSQFGETASTAFNASIFLFLINLLLPSVVGFFLMLKKSNA